ncbi:MAG TPA: mycofactocin-coupled SDR family oxidoreductase [Pseudonocardia sp.]|jgi:(+)-trans-carveol dehydrogenase|nr:mycofactocin-coupled SDR family oxidoreductase [Pseudonocardia sp.]
MAADGAGSLEGKVAFISGVARGQGRSHALRLAADGARIIGFDLCTQIDVAPFDMSTTDDLAETQRLVREAGGEIVTVVGDVRDQEQVDAALAAGLEAFGRVDIVLANAGIGHSYRPAWELSDEEFREVVDVNLIGVWRTVKAAVPTMIEQGDGGAIVVTGSGASTRGIPNIGGYVAAKHGLIGLVHTLAKELGRHQIRINAVLPGNTWTPMFDNDGIRRLYVPGSQEPSEEVFTARAAAMSPMRVPWVEASDISEAVAWLVSPAARYVSGTAVPVDAASSTP